MISGIEDAFFFDDIARLDADALTMKSAEGLGKRRHPAFGDGRGIDLVVAAGIGVEGGDKLVVRDRIGRRIEPCAADRQPCHVAIPLNLQGQGCATGAPKAIDSPNDKRAVHTSRAMKSRVSSAAARAAGGSFVRRCVARNRSDVGGGSARIGLGAGRAGVRHPARRRRQPLAGRGRGGGGHHPRAACHRGVRAVAHRRARGRDGRGRRYELSRLFRKRRRGIFRTTPEGRYLEANPALARIYGYAGVAALKTALTDIEGQLYVDPRRRAAFAAEMQAHDRVTAFESEIRRRDGTTIWISENARAVRDWSGRLVLLRRDGRGHLGAPCGASGAESRACGSGGSEPRKSSFLAAMSHELKTPLNAVLGFSEIIKGEMLGPITPARYRDYGEDIYASGTRLLAIISDVLDVARLSGGAITLNSKPYFAAALVDEAVSLARVATGDERAVAMDADETLPPVRRRSATAAPGGDQPGVECAQIHARGRQRARGARRSRGRRHDIRRVRYGQSAWRPRRSRRRWSRSASSTARWRAGSRVRGWAFPSPRSLAELHGGTLAIEKRGRARHDGDDLPAVGPDKAPARAGKLRLAYAAPAALNTAHERTRQHWFCFPAAGFDDLPRLGTDEVRAGRNRGVRLWPAASRRAGRAAGVLAASAVSRNGADGWATTIMLPIDTLKAIGGDGANRRHDHRDGANGLPRPSCRGATSSS